MYMHIHFLYMTHRYCPFSCSSDVQGVVTLSNMTSKILKTLKGNFKSTDKATKVLYKQFEMVSIYTKFHKY